LREKLKIMWMKKGMPIWRSDDTRVQLLPTAVDTVQVVDELGEF
jgi:hypothetical protein